MIFVSACLLGENCKYNGGNNDNQAVRDYVADREYLAFCPEMAAGLSCPRSPCEILGQRVINKLGQDVTAEFCAGAELAAGLCGEKGVKLAILKEGSPSCGVHEIYDGSHTHRRIPGQGLTAQRLLALGIKCLSEEDIANGRY